VQSGSCPCRIEAIRLTVGRPGGWGNRRFANYVAIDGGQSIRRGKRGVRAALTRSARSTTNGARRLDAEAATTDRVPGPIVVPVSAGGLIAAGFSGI
jgi:hypothetical protein